MQAGFYAPYLKNFLKKLITEVELEHGCVLDNLYELYAHYMTSIKVQYSSKVFRPCGFLLLEILDLFSFFSWGPD